MRSCSARTLRSYGSELQRSCSTDVSLGRGGMQSVLHIHNSRSVHSSQALTRPTSALNGENLVLDCSETQSFELVKVPRRSNDELPLLWTGRVSVASLFLPSITRGDDL